MYVTLCGIQRKSSLKQECELGKMISWRRARMSSVHLYLYSILFSHNTTSIYSQLYIIFLHVSRRLIWLEEHTAATSRVLACQ